MGSANGQKGFIEAEEKFLNDGNTISFGQDTATMYYQEYPYFTGDKIKILKPRLGGFNKNNARFILASMRYAFSTFSWGSSSFSVEMIVKQKANLPVTPAGEIDFAFMESFIAELEALRIAELEAYLTAAGLKDCTMTPEEDRVLEEFGRVAWKGVAYQDLFEHIVQGRRLKKEDQLPGNIPFVMSGTANTGVINHVSNPVAKFPKNSITLDIFGNAFYRGYAYGAGDDTGVYWNSENEYSKEAMLFLTAAMEKSVLGKFSYGKKLRSSKSLDIKMTLPIRDGSPDFAMMETFISAIQKLVIKDVVLYADRKIAATRSIVGP